MAKHAKHAKQASDATEDAVIEVSAEQASSEGGVQDAPDGDVPDHATGQSPDFVAPVANIHKRKSRRMRIVLIVVSVVLVLLLAALVYFAFTLVNEANSVAYQTASRESSDAPSSLASDAQDDENVVHGDVPALSGLLGKTTDDAIAEVGRGATITSQKDITEETGKGDKKKTQVVGTSVTVALADETTDNSGNTPTLYFDCDKDGVITRVGYSTSVASLNYGDMSFADIVQNGHIVENLLSDAGLPTDDGAVTLPATDDYRTYADDGTTIVQEAYTFSGTSNATDGSSHKWSCRLSYDYSAANVSGNLADTIKLVQLYINA